VVLCADLLRFGGCGEFLLRLFINVELPKCGVVNDKDLVLICGLVLFDKLCDLLNYIPDGNWFLRNLTNDLPLAGLIVCFTGPLLFDSSFVAVLFVSGGGFSGFGDGCGGNPCLNLYYISYYCVFVPLLESSLNVHC
jgi:hypothetical protein